MLGTGNCASLLQPNYDPSHDVRLGVASTHGTSAAESVGCARQASVATRCLFWPTQLQRPLLLGRRRIDLHRLDAGGVNHVERQAGARDAVDEDACDVRESKGLRAK